MINIKSFINEKLISYKENDILFKIIKKMFLLDCIELFLFIITSLLHDGGPFDTQSGHYFYLLMILYVIMFYSLIIFIKFIFIYYLNQYKKLKYVIYAILLNSHILIIAVYLILIRIDYL